MSLGGLLKLAHLGLQLLDTGVFGVEVRTGNKVLANRLAGGGVHVLRVGIANDFLEP